MLEDVGGAEAVFRANMDAGLAQSFAGPRVRKRLSVARGYSGRHSPPNTRSGELK